jgi:hypothetical protein
MWKYKHEIVSYKFNLSYQNYTAGIVTYLYLRAMKYF